MPVVAHTSIHRRQTQRVREHGSMHNKMQAVSFCMRMLQKIGLSGLNYGSFPMTSWYEKQQFLKQETFVYVNITERVWQGPAAHHPEANKQPRLVERKVCFISNASSWGEEGGGRLSKGQLTLSPLHWQPVGIELLYTEGEVTCRNSTVSSDSHLQIDQHHPDCFRYS